MINDTTPETIKKIISNHRIYFESNITKKVDFRIEQLKKLKKAILSYENEINNALWKDLHKSPEEVYLTEISIVLAEIDLHIKNLKTWAKPTRVSTPLHVLPSSSQINYEPLGVALIIAPWNYPFQLLFNSLIGAISSGCCAILKPSPDVPNISRLMEEIVQRTFQPGYVSIVQGGKEVNTLLLQERFDIIFFTGSSKVGKVVMKAAAENLTPVVLELGGKSPCIVDDSANIDIAAKRIVWGKLINAGQTCIAPDYLYVQENIKEKLLSKMVEEIKLMYGEDPKESRFYPRIVTSNAVDRLAGLLNEGDVYYGGEINRADRYIQPTIIDNVQPHYQIMQEEIFGPLFPVMTFRHVYDALDYINAKEKPLAFYYFGNNDIAKEILLRTSSGGACINDTLMHISNHHLPFGGVGNSGMGKYHGKESFLAFSNARSIVSTPTWIDIPMKYIPFKHFKWIKKLI